MMRDTDQDWDYIGNTNPYWGVLSHDRFLSARIDDADLQDFFATGDDHIRAVFSTIESSFSTGFRPKRALDFGCGVGRLLPALAQRCDSVIGVDVSPSMLSEARKNCASRKLDNVSLLRTDDDLAALGGSFDFIHSFIVFQHIPPDRGFKMIERLIERLSENGVAALHVTYEREASPLRKFVNRIRKASGFVTGMINLAQGKRFGEPLVQMNSYHLNGLFMTLQQRFGVSRILVEFTSHGEHLGVFMFFQKPHRLPVS